MTEQEQVDGLYAVQGYDHDLEAQLHEARVLSVRPFDAERVHVSTTYELVLDSGHLCIFKPADGLLEAAADGLFHGKQALAQDQHTPLSTAISECAAWQLAKQLGPPWSDLVATTVMKFPHHPETNEPMVGAASIFRGGDVGKRGFYDAVPDQVSEAAFFDALIGQQDRNKGNVLWYEERQRIYLIDHSLQLCPNRRPARLVGSGPVALGARLTAPHRARTRRPGPAAGVRRPPDAAPLPRTRARRRPGSARPAHARAWRDGSGTLSLGTLTLLKR